MTPPLKALFDGLHNYRIYEFPTNIRVMLYLAYWIETLLNTTSLNKDMKKCGHM